MFSLLSMYFSRFLLIISLFLILSNFFATNNPLTNILVSIISDKSGIFHLAVFPNYGMIKK